MIRDKLAAEEVPSALFTKIQTELDSKKKQAINDVQRTLETVTVSSLSKNEILENAPTVDQLMNHEAPLEGREL